MQKIRSDEISFKNSSIFGKGIPQSTISDTCKFYELLTKGLLSLDGLIEPYKPIPKSTLWMYIRYIWHFNRDKPSFATDFKYANGTLLQPTHLSARGLVAHVLNRTDPENITVAEAQSITPDMLVTFINNLIQRHASIIEIPFLKLLLKSVLVKLDGPLDSSANSSFTRTSTKPVTVRLFSNTNSNEQVKTAEVEQKPGQLSVAIKV